MGLVGGANTRLSQVYPLGLAMAAADVMVYNAAVNRPLASHWLGSF